MTLELIQNAITGNNDLITYLLLIIAWPLLFLFIRKLSRKCELTFLYEINNRIFTTVIILFTLLAINSVFFVDSFAFGTIKGFWRHLIPVLAFIQHVMSYMVKIGIGIFTFLSLYPIANIVLTEYLGKKYSGFGNYQRYNVTVILKKLIGSGVFVLAVIFAASLMGVDVGNIWVTIGGLSIVIGFSLQTIFANIFAGLFLAIETPFAVNDLIKTVEGDTYQVLSRGIRVVTVKNIKTHEIVYLPNLKLVNEPLVDLTRPTTDLRVIIDIAVAYGSDIREVREILKDIANGHPHVIGKYLVKKESIKCKVNRLFIRKVFFPECVWHFIELARLKCEDELNDSILNLKHSLLNWADFIDKIEDDGFDKNEKIWLMEIIKELEEKVVDVISLMTQWQLAFRIGSSLGENVPMSEIKKNGFNEFTKIIAKYLRGKEGGRTAGVKSDWEFIRTGISDLPETINILESNNDDEASCEMKRKAVEEIKSVIDNLHKDTQKLIEFKLGLLSRCVQEINENKKSEWEYIHDNIEMDQVNKSSKTDNSIKQLIKDYKETLKTIFEKEEYVGRYKVIDLKDSTIERLNVEAPLDFGISKAQMNKMKKAGLITRKGDIIDFTWPEEAIYFKCKADKILKIIEIENLVSDLIGVDPEEYKDEGNRHAYNNMRKEFNNIGRCYNEIFSSYSNLLVDIVAFIVKEEKLKQPDLYLEREKTVEKNSEEWNKIQFSIELTRTREENQFIGNAALEYFLDHPLIKAIAGDITDDDERSDLYNVIREWGDKVHMLKQKQNRIAKELKRAKSMTIDTLMIEMADWLKTEFKDPFPSWKYPIVPFESFGDFALNLTLVLYIDNIRMEKYLRPTHAFTQFRLRFCERLENAGISIPYFKEDLQLDARALKNMGSITSMRNYEES